MIEPGLLMASGVGAGAALIAGVRTRRPSSRAAGRLDPADVGLREFPARGAFVQYSAPASPACRVSLNRLAATVAVHHTETIVIELHGRAGDHGRAVPTVLYVDSSGEVVQRWAGPPERAELEELLAG
ncbi:MAG TPA: hypothetical protein VGQ45_08040 [Gaiellales bacterium]|jgi:hypothetical protein|nr:hypothetical protein [Gaiellales bacterium]